MTRTYAIRHGRAIATGSARLDHAGGLEQPARPCRDGVGTGHEVNAEPGCLQYELFTSTHNPENLCLLELWQDRAAFLAHWGLQATRQSRTAAFAASAEERKVGKAGPEIYYNQGAALEAAKILKVD